jgi:hypothetical protein
LTIELRDGSRATLRPIQVGDKDLLARAFERLSEDSRYPRFFTPDARAGPGFTLAHIPARRSGVACIRRSA